MKYYISDPHFGHKNILRYCHRPFSTVSEMNETIIRRWNEALKEDPDPIVYILGDLMLNSNKRPEQYLSRLNGRLILIRGNHDETWEHKTDLSLWFEQVADRLELVEDGGERLTLCHGPWLDPQYTQDENQYMIHGHIHNNTHMEEWPEIRNNPRLLNASVEITDYRPLTFEQLKKANAQFKSEHP